MEILKYENFRILKSRWKMKIEVLRIVIILCLKKIDYYYSKYMNYEIVEKSDRGVAMVSFYNFDNLLITILQHCFV